VSPAPARLTLSMRDGWIPGEDSQLAEPSLEQSPLGRVVP
jgi:hypothetical protein